MPTDIHERTLGPWLRFVGLVVAIRWEAQFKLAKCCSAPASPSQTWETITIRERDAATHLPPQYDQLMSERSVLCLKSALRLERRGEQGQEEAEQSDHRR